MGDALVVAFVVGPVTGAYPKQGHLVLVGEEVINVLHRNPFRVVVLRGTRKTNKCETDPV
jgi:hypothetical protein